MANILAKVSFGAVRAGLSTVTYSIVSPTDGTTVLVAATGAGVVEVAPGGLHTGDYQVYVSDAYAGDTIFWNSGEASPAFITQTLTPPPAVAAALPAVDSSGRVTVGGYATGQDPATLVLAATVDGPLSALQVLRLLLAILTGKATDASGTYTVKRVDGTTTALTVVHDIAGNRTASTVGTV